MHIIGSQKLRSTKRKGTKNQKESGIKLITMTSMYHFTF